MFLAWFFLVLSVVPRDDASDVTRDFFGDIFRMRDCHNGSRCDGGGRRAALQVPGRPCYCQCAPTHLAYREDKQQCVKDIKDCYMSVFYRPFTVEAIPLVYLPTSGQLVHPDAHLSLSMRRNFEGGMAKCKVTFSQYLTRDGWKMLAKMDGSGGSVFGLFTDANKTYLQFLGSSHERKLLQQHMALIRLLCVIPQFPAFETCVAIRVGWVPGVENIEDLPTPSNKANMMVVGLSLGVLALVYIFAVLVYLKIRRQMIAKQKASTDHEAKLQAREEEADKASPLHRLEASSRLELYHSASLGRQSPNKNGFRNNCDTWSQFSPVVETYNRTWTDRMGQHSSEFRAQDFKLQPEFFEPEFMASPPHEVLEYLERLQNSITFARHRMRNCYRYQPTLNGIPEDDYFYQELDIKDPPNKDIRSTPDGGSTSSVGSVQEPCEQKNDLQKRELPKIPPRKPKRKFHSEKTENSPESAQSSDQEQKEIQKAMNTLNDTLDALEYDIYKQEILNQTSDSETANLSCQNSTSIDFDDFETSSCSSMSAITILGRDPKRFSDISKCSQFMEKNHSEDFSTFSNSTYSLNEAMRGLFHDGNKATNDVAKSDASSRCSSRADESPNSVPQKYRKMNIRKEINTCDSSYEGTSSRKDHLREEQRISTSTNNFSKERNGNTPTCQERGKKNSGTLSHDYGKININRDGIHRNIGSPCDEYGRLQNFKCPGNESFLKNQRPPVDKESGNKNIITPNTEILVQSDTKPRNSVTPNPEEVIPNNQVNTDETGRNSNLENERESRSSSREEHRHRNNSASSFQEQRTISSPCQENRERSLSSLSDCRRMDSPGFQERDSPNINQGNHSRNIRSPDEERRYKNKSMPRFQETEQRNISSPNQEYRQRNVSSPTEEQGNRKKIQNFNRKERRDVSTSYQGIPQRNIVSPSEEPKLRNNTPDYREKEEKNVSSPSGKENVPKKSTDSEGQPLRKSPSTESMATDMTTDSLDSRCSSPSRPSPTPSLMEMWISKLVSTSYSKNRRKSKKKLILPEDEVESWEHVCQKHKDPSCPRHDLNDSEPNLIDKLAHYSSKTMAGCDVAGYFQSLKQDVLKEHLKTWLSSNNQRHKKGLSLNYGSECSHTKPLVNGQESNLVDENGMHLSGSANTQSTSVEPSNDASHKGKQDVNIMNDSLEPDSTEILKTNESIYSGEIKDNSEKSVAA